VVFPLKKSGISLRIREKVLKNPLSATSFLLKLRMKEESLVLARKGSTAFFVPYVSFFYQDFTISIDSCLPG
jgi:hypothetical protein